MTTQSRGAGEPTHIVNRDGSDGPLIWRRATTQKRRDVMQLAQLRTPRGARKRERRRERRCDRRAVDRGVWCMRTAGFGHAVCMKRSFWMVSLRPCGPLEPALPPPKEAPCTWVIAVAEGPAVPCPWLTRSCEDGGRVAPITASTAAPTHAHGAAPAQCRAACRAAL
eukprot:scaffold44193_cov76-Phaeocystis_antarctica.AAC.5